MKVYGIYEDKCREEVYSKAQANDKFLSKTDSSEQYAPKNHASSNDIYGKATDKIYGHVKLTTSTGIPSGDIASGGYALAGTMGYTLSQQISDAKTAMRIPIKGMFITDGSFRTAQAVSDLLGYGTWQLYCIIKADDVTSVYFYQRTA